MKYLFLFTSVFLVLGCSSGPLKDLDSVQLGMEKSQVLDIMGSPDAKKRSDDTDRWIYHLHQNHQIYDKEVDFKNYQCTYVGDLVKPVISAEDKDRQNEVLNQTLDRQDQEKHEAAKKAFSVFEEKTRGDDQIRYVPKFVPVN